MGNLLVTKERMLQLMQRCYWEGIFVGTTLGSAVATIIFYFWR